MIRSLIYLLFMTAFIKAILDYIKDNGDVLYHAPIASVLLLCIGFGLGYGWLQRDANANKSENNASKTLLKLEEEKLEKLKKEFFDLQEENKKLKESPKKNIELIRKGEFYYKENDVRPFCPVCYDTVEPKIVLLVKTPLGFGYRYKCMNCDAIYLLDEYLKSLQPQKENDT